MDIQITTERLRHLEEAEAKLEALESAGVDNWDGYEFALEELNKSKARRNALQDCLEEIEASLFEGAYEPSERGAGFCSTDKARAVAETVLTSFIQKWYVEKEVIS